MGSECTGRTVWQEGGLDFLALLLLDLLSSVLLLLLASTSREERELSVEQSPIANDLMHHDWVMKPPQETLNRAKTFILFKKPEIDSGNNINKRSIKDHTDHCSSLLPGPPCLPFIP